MVREMSSDRALYQLSRLRLAVPYIMGWQRRKRFAQCLVLSTLRWGGRWQRPPKHVYRKWDTLLLD
eukprot:3540969-Pyramimonas_sp.AAC.1